MEKVIAGDARSGVVLAAHRLGAGPVRDGAEHRRHPRAPEAARRARAGRRKRSSPTCGRSCRRRRRWPRSSSSSCCRTCSAISRAAPTPIEVKIFGDDPDMLAELAEPVEEMLEQDRRRRRRRRHAARQSRGDVERSIRSRPARVRADRRTSVATQLAAAWLGDVATDLRLLDRRVPVRVRLPDAVPLRSRRSCRRR